MAKRKIDPLSIRMLVEIAALLTVLAVLLTLTVGTWMDILQKKEDDGEKPKGSTTESTEPPDTSPQGILNTFIKDNGLQMSDYPAWLLESYAIATESRDFILHYPLKKDNTYTVDISGTPRDTVPLFLQWDERWGYKPYGVSIGGIGGCGPTCLSMVAYYLTGDAKYTPVYMMDYATNNAHVIPTGGTDWSLFGTGAVKLGFEVEQLPNVERNVVRRLEAGKPVVINVGPGTFTTTGHYMVLVGYEDGKFRINDPNSPANSARLWAWDEFQSEVRNFWAISLPAEGN